MRPAALVAEVPDPDALVRVVGRLRTLGYRRLDTLTPYPLHELDELLDLPHSGLPFWALLGGLGGGGGAWLVQWWVNVVRQRTDVGGRPLHAAPMFVPITFEVTVLVAAFATVIAWMVACGLPALWHPLFEVEGVERATVDAWLVVVDGGDPSFDEELVRRTLAEEGAIAVRTVPARAVP